MVAVNLIFRDLLSDPVAGPKLRNRLYMRGYVAANKDRIREWQRSWRQRPIGKVHMRRNLLRKEYGLSLEEYEDMVIAQGGKCALCLTAPGSSKPS